MSWLRIKAIARRQSYVVKRAPQRWFDVVVWPVVDAVLFGSIGVYFARSSAPRSHQLAYLLVGIVLFHVIFQAEVSLATGFLEETWSRNLLNLLVTPLREVEFVAGVVLFGTLKMVAAVSVVSGVAALAFAFHITDVGLGLIPLMAILVVVGWSLALVVIGIVLRVGQGADILTWGGIALLMPLSGVFYPVNALPGPLQPLAKVLPTTHVFAAARTVISGGSLPLGQVVVAAAGSVVLSALSVAFVLQMLATFRQRGYITRHT
ncbi:MAG TPA: ABC transporter permease [Acidimicrobiales bacterium]|nr:ABC transporter permease [Acidimicrobiales bacterium]